MKAFTIGSVVFLLVIFNVLADDFKLKIKVKNVLTDQEEDEDIDIDTDKGTEVIKAGGQTSMKDMKTGYTAIKSSDNICMIVKNDPSEKQESAEKLKEELAGMKDGEEPKIVAETSSGVKTSTAISDEKRAEIGQNLIDFCGNLSIVLGEEESEDGNDDDAEEVSEEEARNFIDMEEKGLKGEDAADGNSKSDTQGLSRRKRALRYRCVYSLIRVRYCSRRLRFVRYCSRYYRGRCLSYRYRYSYYCYYYYRTFLRRTCSWTWY